MAKFDIAIPKILAYEGGYVFHKADPGGETNRGITDRLDGKVDHAVDIDGDSVGDVAIKDLSEEQAKTVYKRVFWDRMQGDHINSQAIADMLMDGYVNCGKQAIKIIQRVIGVKDDGAFGPATLLALNEATKEHIDEVKIYRQFKEARIAYYHSLVEKKPDLEVFLKGWLNRMESFKEL